MKPEGWDDLKPEVKQEFANVLLTSMRGNYILGQALHYAIKALSEAPKEFRENSNIQDMEMLRECIFNFPVQEANWPQSGPRLVER